MFYKHQDEIKMEKEILMEKFRHLFLFAKKGFTQGCIEKAGKMGNVSLVTYDQIYRYLNNIDLSQ